MKEEVKQEGFGMRRTPRSIRGLSDADLNAPVCVQENCSRLLLLDVMSLLHR